MPLRALLNGADFSAEDLTESNRRQKYLCPNCPSDLIPVIPKKDIIRHFRHVNGKSHYEPETTEHLSGKKALLQICQKLGLRAIPEFGIGARGHVKTP